MIRKTLIALAATTAVGIAALAPTAASAKGIHFGGGWGHGGFGFRGVGITVVDPGYNCLQTQWVKVGRRTYQKQLVNVCD
jgi:Spy/CpxP family protein refolding chaperone